MIVLKSLNALRLRKSLLQRPVVCDHLRIKRNVTLKFGKKAVFRKMVRALTIKLVPVLEFLIRVQLASLVKLKLKLKLN